ncbi:hypothetical protein Tco_0668560 [Tanacetum coccineum]
MADQRTMAELLRAPTEGYAEAIVVPPILAQHFELKHSLIKYADSTYSSDLERKTIPHDPHRWGQAVTGLNLRNEISNFQQRFDEPFHEAWDRYKDLLHACPHHGFTELHQLDTFYNSLNPADQDSLNSAAGGNLLERSTQDVLTIIENKSKVRNSRDGNSSSSDIAKLTHEVNQQTSDVTTAMTAILKQFQATLPPASVKAVEEVCVTCGGAHPYYQCLAADGNTFPEYRDNIQGYVAAAAVSRHSSTSSRDEYPRYGGSEVALKENFNEMSIEINKKKKLQQLEQVANLSTYPSRHFNSFCYDDDDDEEYTISITPEKPVDSLIMEDEHLDTIPETESDEFIKSSVENLVPTPSDSEDFSDIESECDVPDCDDSQTTNFSTFSNPLFDDSTFSDDELSHEEVIHEMSFKTFSNPLFDLDEEIISSEFNPIHNEDLDSTPKDVRFDAESYLLESLVNHDTLMASPPKIDFLLDEFAGELTRLQSIPPGIDNINLDPEGDILFLESPLYDNSSPQPPEDFHAIPNTIIESLPTFSIPVEDSDSLREEIDIFPGPDDSIPPGIESDDFNSKDDDNSTSLPEFDLFHVDYPDSGDSTINVVEDIPVDVPNILPTHPTLHMDFDLIPSNDLGSDHDVFSPSRNRNKISCYFFPRD